MSVGTNGSSGEDGAAKCTRKSTNMVPVSSIEIRGPEVRCVFEEKLCDCADEQTEANDRYTARRETLAASPQFTRADAPTKHNTVCKWTRGAQNSGTFKRHSGKNSTNLFCILSTNT